MTTPQTGGETAAQRHNRLFHRPLPEPTIDIPDHVLVDTMCGYGFDRRETFVRWRHSMPVQYRSLRNNALRFYADVIAAGRGDADARERVDYCAEVWRTMLKRRLQEGVLRNHDLNNDERRILRKMGVPTL